MMGVSMQSFVKRVAAHRVSAAVATGVSVIAIAGVAVAADPTVMKGSARVGGKTKAVVVSSAGQTLYTLSDERVGNLKCLTKGCFAVWPPVKVGANDKLTKGPGVSGNLSKLRRVKGGFYQVMLNGKPLYRFSGDNNTKGSAKGDGIRSYGGTWRVVTP
jgi:predicted lipoprotein with Yx(FWY)xxD motif